MSDPHLPSDTEIVISRILHAPRELVWDAWTNPKHVVNWWGPRGFTNTTKRHEFRVGGYWEHVMHGPDGTDYPNKAKFLEIVPHERIIFLLGGGSDLEADERRGTTFRATWTFEVVDAGRTRLTGRMVFPSKEARDRVVRDYGAIEGGKQTLERAAEYIAGLQCEPFVISREFDAPRELVWRAWTEREHVARWLGPKGFKIEIHQFELRPGGMNHYRMISPDGHEMWGRAVYREIVPPTRLVWINSFSDKDGGITTHPMSPTWPREMLTTVTFAERGGKTAVTVRWVPFDATEAERNTFNPARTGMAGGWSGSFDQLAAHLVEMQSRS
jgi:uncharacterized protein YndB with AHSA1/START domain